MSIKNSDIFTLIDWLILKRYKTLLFLNDMKIQVSKTKAFRHKENSLVLEFKKGLEATNKSLNLSGIVSSFFFFDRVRASLGISDYQCRILFVLIASSADNVPGMSVRALSDCLHGYRVKLALHTYGSISGLVSLGMIYKYGGRYSVSDECYVRLIGLLT